MESSSNVLLTEVRSALVGAGTCSRPCAAAARVRAPVRAPARPPAPTPAPAARARQISKLEGEKKKATAEKDVALRSLAAADKELAKERDGHKQEALRAQSLSRELTAARNALEAKEREVTGLHGDRERKTLHASDLEIKLRGAAEELKDAQLVRRGARGCAGVRGGSAARAAGGGGGGGARAGGRRSSRAPCLRAPVPCRSSRPRSRSSRRSSSPRARGSSWRARRPASTFSPRPRTRPPRPTASPTPQRPRR